MRKIAVFTGTRAEYGLMYWIMKGLKDHKYVDFQLFVGGMHLSKEFGYTIKEIIDDGFDITERFEFLISSDSSVAIGKSMALALISACEAFNRHNPDLVVILGDRFESLSVAQAAMISRIPVAHIHGGEITQGSIDDAARHSISKIAQLHFTSTEQHKKRVIQLGENPKKVFNYGAPGIDSINSLDLLSKKQLSESLGFKLDKPYFLVTFHPVTLKKSGSAKELANLISAMNHYPNYKVLLSYPNADMDNAQIIKLLNAFYKENKDRVFLFQSLGQLKYLSAMKYCDAVLGNSSSGLIEAPTFGKPTLNIGSRQKGRLFGNTVFNCNSSKKSILEGLDVILSTNFINKCKKEKNPYGVGGASKKIVTKLASVSLKDILQKEFYDL